jgi:Ni,Fe-hydrogenase III component G
MTPEEKIKESLVNHFRIPETAIIIVRARRIFVSVDLAVLRPLIEYAIAKLGCSMLCAITGLDDGDNLSLIYHLATDKGVMLNLKTSVPKTNPVIPTVMGYFSCAEVYEREITDLLGFKVEGLPAGNRYPLIDDWPQGEFPLRKDWKPQAS